MQKIVIIGNGVAGTNAARYIRKLSDNQVIMISEETLQPFSRTALMYVYMGHVRQQDTELYEDWFWEKNRIDRIKARVTNVDILAKKVHLNNGKSVSYDKLILATGSKSNKFGWKGQDLEGVRGLYHLQDLEYIQKHSQGLQRAVIVGGGLIGIELAEMFASRGIFVTFLVREQSFWNNILPAEESEMINRHIKEHHIDLRLASELDEIIGDENGKVKAIKIKNGEIIECGFVGLTVGVSPNLLEIDIEKNRGFLANEYLMTSNPDVYAIGDCMEMRTPQAGRRPIEAIWYTGRMAGQTVAHTICEKPTKYIPKLWFNSAKFFDIEYQVYGEVLAKKPEGVQSLYWEHKNGKKAIRINFQLSHTENHKVLPFGSQMTPLEEDLGGAKVKGFNLMGIRYRHEVCEKWILEGASIEEVLQNLSLANFDPEFFDEFENELIKMYNQLTGNSLELKSKRKLNLVQRFLQK